MTYSASTLALREEWLPSGCNGSAEASRSAYVSSSFTINTVGGKTARAARMPRSEPYRGALAVVAACACLLPAITCGGKSQTEVIGPDQVRCATAISSTSARIPGDGGRVSIAIDAARECEWSVASEAPWLQFSSTRGQGAGTLVITAVPNILANPRTARVQINDQQLSVTQEARPCRFEFQPSSIAIGPRGGHRTLLVSTAAACSWQASTVASWLSLSNVNQTGPGAVDVDIEPFDGDRREGEVRIAGQAITVTQTSTEPPPPIPTPPPSSSAIPAPRALSARAVSDTTIDLSWSNADSAAQTMVFRNGVAVATKDAGSASHQDSGLSRGTDYTYVVRHVKNGVGGVDSNSAVARPVFLATGGSISTAGGYRQHLFTSSGSFVVTQGGTIDEIIIIGGGGGGGGSEAGTEWGSGGGGAGGVRVITTRTESPGTYSIVIGSGGRGGGHASSRPEVNDGAPGQASSYAGETAQGGGAGAGSGTNNHAHPGYNGGSGGGGAGAAGGAGVPGQGNAGGAGAFNRGGAAGGGGGGGKGGPGAAGTNIGGNGGAGFSTWAGTVASGGRGGRSAGNGSGGSAPGDGGQGNMSGENGGAGASGAVLIRYRQ